MDTGDWRTQLQPGSRQRILNRILETLERHLPYSGHEGLKELRTIAVRFEETIYTAATSESDYLRKVSLRMLTMGTNSPNTDPNSSTSSRPPDPGASSQSMPPQVPDQGQSLPMPLSANQSQTPQDIQNNVAPTGDQSSSSFQSALPTVSSLTQTFISNAIGQNHRVQSISGVSQNSLGSSMGQNMPSSMFANTQRQMAGRRQVVYQQLQQQPPPTSQQYLYQQPQLQHQMMKQKQQQQQQQLNLLQPNQLQSSQQSGMQTSIMQSISLSNIQQNAPPSVQQSTESVLHQHPQSGLRPHQQQQQVAGISQQQLLQQPQLMGQQANSGSMSQNQLIGQDNNMGDIQPQRLLNQQNNLQNLQQQLMTQQNNLSNMHQQQLSAQSNISSLQQQQQLLGSQSGNSSMQADQHSVHMMKSRPSFPISSPQLLPAASPQLQQHSPQVDQQNLLSSLTRTGTPVQSANSRYIVPSSSTPLASSPVPGDSEKPISGISSLSNADTAGQQQTTSAQAPAQSLASGTPGISNSPLLAEFTSPDAAHESALAAVSSKSSLAEKALERLIKAVNSSSSKAWNACVCDISSVVSMTDRIAGSAPGNGSRAAVGEDLVAMTKCRLQARNFIAQEG